MEKARKNRSEIRIKVRIESGKVRDLHRFLWNMLSDLVYDMEVDRYVMDGGNSSKSIDREFYNTLCEVTEELSSLLATNRSVATI